MKKLLGAAAIAALVAGVASADVSININGRVRGNAAEWGLASEAENSASYASLDGDSAVVASGASDTLTFNASNEYAGVKFAFSNKMTGGSAGVDSYNAWLKFGNLKIQGNYGGMRSIGRVTGDQNAVSLLEANLSGKGVVSTGSDAAGWTWTKVTYGNSGKLGINKQIIALTGAGVGADVNNLGAINGTTALTYGVEYPVIEDLTLKAYLNKDVEAWSTTDDDGATTTVNSQWAFEAAYKMADTVQLAFDARLAGHRQQAFGLYVKPLMVENLDAVLGFTFARDAQTAHAIDKTNTFWAVDARARYAVSDAMAFTLFANLTGYGDIYSTNKDEADLESGLALDLTGNFSYKVNDLAKVFVEAEYATLTFDSDMQEGLWDSYVPTAFTTQLGAILTAGKGATVTPALRLTVAGLGLDSDGTAAQGMLISLPIVTRVCL
ncbi:MAG: hypothetical protein K6F69_02920 [Treponema sp.]|nr:hypothetical protein [Treponema sp.]